MAGFRRVIGTVLDGMGWRCLDCNKNGRSNFVISGDFHFEGHVPTITLLR